MAFGDQLNDIEMLNQAYYSFAVANAREEVRRLPGSRRTAMCGAESQDTERAAVRGV